MIAAHVMQLHGRLIGLSFRGRAIWCFLLGAVSALAFVPVSILPVLIPALVGLFWLSHAANRPRTALWLGWFFGLGHFSVGLYWIGNAFFVYPEKHALLAVPGVLGLAAAAAGYMALTCWAYHHLSRRLFADAQAGLRHVMLFAVLWTLLEFARAWAFTGFPWNLIGSIWVASDEVLQLAAFGGVYLLSLLSIFVATLPAIIIAGGREQWMGHMIKIALGFVLLGGVWAGGAWRLSQAEQSYVDGVVLRLVQPNIPQAKKWQRDLRSDHVLKLVRMSLQPSENGLLPSHVIWPETAVPFDVPGAEDLMMLLSQAVPKGGTLIGGSLRRSERVAGVARRDVWNSMFVMGDDGTVIDGYDKAHLVPFGEYVPFQEILPIEKLTDGAVGFAAGDGRKTLSVPGLPPFSPLICYEVIFPSEVVDADNRPDWMLNITNDAWYGYSAGPFQHFASAQLRAVEEGMPVVRVANTGISGLVNSYGQIISSLDLETNAILDVRLPGRLATTVYATWQLLIPMGICAGILIFLGISGVVSRRR